MSSALWNPRSRRMHMILLLSLSYFCSSLIVVNFGLNLTCMVEDHPRNATKSKCHRVISSKKNNDYGGTLKWTRHQETVLISATSWGSLVAQLPSMFIARRLPATLLLQLVMVTHVLFNALIPVAAVYIGYVAVFVLRVLIGVSHAFIDVAIYSLIDKWFPRFERSTALAVFSVGGQVAGIVGGPLTGAICGSSLGWQTNFYLISAIGCVFCVLWQLFSAESPRSCNGITENELSFLKENVHVAEKSKGPVPYRKMLLCVAVWAEFQMNFSCCVAQTITQSFFPQFFKEQVMISPVMNGYFTAIPNLCSFIVRLAWCSGVDYFKKRGSLAPTTSTKLSQGISSSGIAIFFLVMAFFVGCNDPGVALAASSLIATSQSLDSAGHITSLLSLAPQYTETLSAISMFWSQTARLVTPYVVGALRKDDVHGWQHVFILAAGLNILSGVLFVIFGSGMEQPWALVGEEDGKEKTSRVDSQREDSESLKEEQIDAKNTRL